MALQQYVIDRINALDLKDPAVLKSRQERYFETILTAIKGWGGKKPTVETVEKAMVLGARLECAKNGMYDIDIEVVYDEKMAPAYVNHSDNTKVFLNFGSSSFMEIIEDIRSVYDIKTTDDKTIHRNVARELFLFSIIPDVITHELEHLRQRNDSLRGGQNPAYKEFFTECVVRKKFNGVGNDFYKHGGHDDFQSEIAANIAGELRREEFVREFLDYLAESAQKSDFTPAQIKEFQIELDDIYSCYYVRYGGKESKQKMNKKFETLFKRAGYTLDKNGNIIDKGPSTTIVDVIMDQYNEAELRQEYSASESFMTPDHKWVPQRGSSPEEKERIKQGFKELADYQKALREGKK